MKLGKDHFNFWQVGYESIVKTSILNFISKCRKYRENSAAQTIGAALTPKVPPTIDANPLLTVNHLKHIDNAHLFISQGAMTV